VPFTTTASIGDAGLYVAASDEYSAGWVVLADGTQTGTFAKAGKRSDAGKLKIKNKKQRNPDKVRADGGPVRGEGGDAPPLEQVPDGGPVRGEQASDGPIVEARPRLATVTAATAISGLRRSDPPCRPTPTYGPHDARPNVVAPRAADRTGHRHPGARHDGGKRTHRLGDHHHVVDGADRGDDGVGVLGKPCGRVGPGQVHRHRRVPAVPQLAHHSVPVPRGAPGARNHHEARHAHPRLRLGISPLLDRPARWNSSAADEAPAARPARREPASIGRRRWSIPAASGNRQAAGVVTQRARRGVCTAPGTAATTSGCS
jgi:hypothetical protein